MVHLLWPSAGYQPRIIAPLRFKPQQYLQYCCTLRHACGGLVDTQLGCLLTVFIARLLFTNLQKEPMTQEEIEELCLELNKIGVSRQGPLLIPAWHRAPGHAARQQQHTPLACCGWRWLLLCA